MRNHTSVLLALALALLPFSAQATSFTWTGGVNSNWVQPTSPYNWSGGSSGNGRSPGSTHTNYTDSATINSATNNPVTLGSAVTLGGTTLVGPSGDQNYNLYIGSSAGINALSINSGGRLSLQGGIYNLKNITINTGGALQNGYTSSGFQLPINGSGTITMSGGSISSLGGTWLNSQAISGYGTISAPMINSSTVTANNSSNALNISGTFTNSTGGTVRVNDTSAMNITGTFTNGSTSVHTPVVNVGTGAGSNAVMTVGTGGSLTNNAVLNVYGTLNNNSATAVNLAASGAQANLLGGTLGGTGSFTNNNTLNASGNIFANLTNAHATGNNTTGTINATGNINVAGNTLTNTGSGGQGAVVNLGVNTLDNTSASTFTMTGGTVNLAGGQITSTGGGGITASSLIKGYGTLAAPINYTGTITAAGGTLAVTGPLTYGNTPNSISANLYAGTGNLLLQSTITGASIAAASGFEVDLNGANLIGGSGTFTRAALGQSSGGSGAIRLTGDSAMGGYWTVNSVFPFQVNGHTLTANNLNLSLPSGTNLDVGSGNLVINGPMSVSSGGGLLLGGGNIIGNAVNNTLSAGVTGRGDITAKLLASNVTASGGTMYIDGGVTLNLMDGTHNNTTLSSSAGSVLDIRSTLVNPAYNNFAFTSYINPNGGTVNLDGATLTSTGNMNIQLNAGSVNVTNNSTMNGTVNSLATLGVVAQLTNNGTLNINGGAVNVTGNGSINGPGNVAVNGAALNVQNSSILGANNFTMDKTATLSTGSNNLLELTGNFSFQQTDTSKWIYDGNPGLGTDLKMAGSSIQLLEVGGVDGNGFLNNFGLESLTLAPGSYVKLVDNFSNAGIAGHEALYLGSLLLGGVGDPIFDMQHINVYVDGQLLQVGDYNGITVTSTPEPGTMLLMGMGLLGAAYARRRRMKNA